MAGEGLRMRPSRGLAMRAAGTYVAIVRILRNQLKSEREEKDGRRHGL